MLNWLVTTRGDRSQYKMAAEIGISQSYYASIEIGSRRPSVAIAKKIGEVMGFDWTRFYEEEGHNNLQSKEAVQGSEGREAKGA